MNNSIRTFGGVSGITMAPVGLDQGAQQTTMSTIIPTPGVLVASPSHETSNYGSNNFTSWTKVYETLTCTRSGRINVYLFVQYWNNFYNDPSYWQVRKNGATVISLTVSNNSSGSSDADTSINTGDEIEVYMYYPRDTGSYTTIFSHVLQLRIEGPPDVATII